MRKQSTHSFLCFITVSTSRKQGKWLLFLQLLI